MSKFIDYIPETAESKWADDARALKDAPEGKAIVIEGDAKARTAFQRAARAEGFTARLVGETELSDGAFEFAFIAAPLIERKAKGEDTEEAEDGEVDGE